MVLKLYYLVSFVLMFVHAISGEISEVSNVVVKAKPLQEISAVLITWDAPTNPKNESELNITLYRVKYCEINKIETCVARNVSTTQINITNLKKDFIYSYHITPLATNGQQGKQHESIFRTENKRTCLPNQYTCAVSDQCIDSSKKCDGIVSCADASDEDINAKCKLPVHTPTNIKTGSIEGESFELTFQQVRASDRVTSYEIEVVNQATNNITTIIVTHSQYHVGPKTKIISQLLPITKYTVRMRAINRIGKGPWSEFQEVKTLLGPPGDVKLPYVTAVHLSESSAVEIKWESPLELNGHSAESLTYQIRYCRLNFPNTCIDLPKTDFLSVILNKLTRNTFYQYKITVFDKNNQTGPHPYENIFKTERKNSCPNGLFRCTLSDQCVLKDRTCNGIPDCGDSSDERLDAGCKPPVNFPRNVKVTNKTTSTIDLSWDSVPLKDRPRLYIIKVSGETDQTKNVQTGFGARIITATIKDLLPNREYAITIRAVNIVGTGVESEKLMVTTEKLPTGDVLELEQSASVTPIKHEESTSVSIAWSAPADLKGNDEQMIRYRVLYCTINTKCAVATPKSTVNKVVLTNLTPRHIYQFTIEVYNANNLMGPKSNYTHFFRTRETDTCKEGLFSCTRRSQCVLQERTCNGIVDCRDGTDEQSAGKCSVPKSTVTLTRTNVTENSITIIFNAVRDMSQRIHRYDVQNLQTNELKAVRHTGFSLQRDISVTFSGLQPGTKYSFRIRAANPSGAGKWSSTFERITKGDKPTTTVGPTVTVAIKTTLTETVTTTEKMSPTSDKPDTSENSKNTGMSSAQKAGIAIGVILAVIIVIIAAIIILRACRLNRKNENVEGLSNSAYEMEKNA